MICFFSEEAKTMFNANKKKPKDFCRFCMQTDFLSINIEYQAHANKVNIDLHEPNKNCHDYVDNKFLFYVFH